MPVAAEEAAGQFGVFALRVHLTSCDSPRARGGGGRRDATDLRDRLEPPWRCSGLLQRNSDRDRSEFSGKAEIGQALEQTICLLLL